MRTVLVTAAGGGASNNLMRVIRRAQRDVRLIGANVDKFYLALSLSERNYLVPYAADEQAYIAAIRTIVQREKVDLIIPGNDVEVGPIARNQPTLGARTFLPSPAAIELAQDKMTLNDALYRAGVPVACSVPLRNLEDIPAAFQRLGATDLVWCRQRRGSASKGSLQVRTPAQADAWIRYWHEMRGVPVDNFMLCDYLPGRDFAFQSIWNKGDLILAKTCERVAYLCGEWMPSGMSSTPRIGRLTDDPRVNDVCVRTVRTVAPDASGLFCIDLKENGDGVPCVTEINIGRFFMISPVFNLSGRYDMADIYLRLAFGEPVSIPEADRFSDIGTEETFLVRELDNEPSVMTVQEIESLYTSLLRPAEN
jgi:carbamoyl-phosphate synthase large subunit